MYIFKQGNKPKALPCGCQAAGALLLSYHPRISCFDLILFTYFFYSSFLTFFFFLFKSFPITHLFLTFAMILFFFIYS